MTARYFCDRCLRTVHLTVSNQNRHVVVACTCVPATGDRAVDADPVRMRHLGYLPAGGSAA